MANKVKGAVVYKTRDGQDASQLPMFSASGEVNAYDKKDALRAGMKLQEMIASGDLIMHSESSAETDPVLASLSGQDLTRARNELFVEAYQAGGDSWASLGSSIVARIENRAERTGLMRNLFQGSTLRMGERAAVELKNNVCHAVVATGPSDLGYQVLRGRIFHPDEFEVKSAVRVPALDIHQISGDLLARAERDAHQAIVTKEDRLMMAAIAKAAGAVNGNHVTTIYDKLLPGHLALMRDQLDSMLIPVAGTVLSSDFWHDMIGSSAWMEALEPVTRYELMTTGRLATLLGMDLITDGFREPTQRVMDRGTLFTFATPEYLGAYTTRGGATSTPTDGANEGNTDKGWLVSEMLSFVLARSQAISFGRRK